MEKICVVVPVYNVEKYISRCVNSIINQTYNNLEIILVDDGSSDKSGILCDEFSKKDNRIMVIHKKNGGLSSARNAGIDKCTAKYIMFVDSDDYLADDAVEYLYDNLKENNCKISICDFYIYHDNEEIINDKSNLCGKVIGSDEALLKMINYRESVYPNASNKLYSFDLFDDIRYPDGKLYEDMIVMASLFILSERNYYGKEKKYFYYMRSDSITNQRYVDKEYDHVIMSERLLEVINENKKNLYNEFIAYHAVNFLSVCNKIFLSQLDKNEIINDYKEYVTKNILIILKSKILSNKKKLQIIISVWFTMLYKYAILKLKK